MLGDVTAGAPIVAGPYVRLACQRHLADRRAAAARGGHPAGWVFSEAAADLVIGFYEQVLRLPDMQDALGDPLPFRLQPSQDFIIGSLFGWLGPDGLRRFREAYIEMGKGNGKTPLLAGMGLYGVTLDGELAAEVYACAVDRVQARIMFSDAERMVDCSPDLKARLLRTVNNIFDPETHSFFRPFSRQQGARSGFRPHMGLIDELHEHPAAEITNKVRAGAKRRPQPLFVEITNSGFDRTSICWQHHEHSVQVLDGVVADDRLFAYVCALDEGDDPLQDPACWIKTNPLLGIAVSEDYLRRQVQNAQHIPAEHNTVLRLNFCVWTQAQSRAIDLGAWRACGPPPPDAALVGKPCFGGLDLGQSDDLSAWVRIWDLEDGRVAVKTRVWIPQTALTRFPNRPYDQWIRAGVLTVTEGNTTDYDTIEDDVLADCQRDGVREVGYDRRFAEQLAQHLLGLGVTMVDQPQGFQLNEACKRLQELILAAALLHGNHPILAYAAANYVERHGRYHDVRPDKEAAGEKIDPIVALLMALARWIRQPQQVESVYATRGLVVVGG